MSVRLCLIAIGSVVVLLAVGVAGCGGGDDSTEAETSPSLTKSEFIQQANAICAEGNKETDAVFGNFEKGEPKPEAETVIEQEFVPSIQMQIDEVRALGAPEGDEETVEEMLDLAQADLERVESDPGIVINGSEVDQFADFAKIAHPYGLTECDKAE